MLLFEHLGITLGITLLINHIIRSKMNSCIPDKNDTSFKSDTNVNIDRSTSRAKISLFELMFCLLGSILPDLIDKPIGHYLFNQTFGNSGRIFSHTLVFLLVILLASIYLYAAKRITWGLFLTFGVFMHLVLDFMWENPKTLFWPFLGLSFPSSTEMNWFWNMLRELLSKPVNYISELISLLFFVMLILVLIITKYIDMPKPREA